MSAFFNTLAANFSFPFDLLDILVVAFIIYEIIQLVRQTRTAQLAKGILVLLIAWAAAMILNMRTLNWIINGIMSFGLVAIVVVFQPELRRALEQVGRANFMGIELFRSKKMPGDVRAAWKSAAVAVCDAAERLSDTCTGALIVFERKTNLSEIIKTGTYLGAEVTPET